MLNLVKICQLHGTKPARSFILPIYSRCQSTIQTEETLKTPLYDFHVKHNGKMVPFAGYLMPVQYGSEGIGTSHIHVRNHVGIFDVSHMLQTKIHGKDAIKFIENVVVSDIQGLKINQGTLSVMTTSSGGIIDDLIVTKTGDGYLYIVSNAGCRDKDLKHLKERLQDFVSKGQGDAKLEIIDDMALLAVQGPGMAKVLQKLVDFDLSKLTFMTTTLGTIGGITGCRITRCGYTGEDGVEISVPANQSAKLAEILLNSKEDDVKLAGLGARDSLRLEAGLCLYGNDIDESCTPIEATLAWLINKRRRQGADFPGAKVILQQIKDGVNEKRVGFVSQGPPARAHTPIVDNEGRQIGDVTSGCPSPSLKTNIAMGYIDTKFSKVGTKVMFNIRKKLVEAEVTKMPFVPTKYFNPKL